jgi:CRP/FNR family transcriptional regulator, cyclic AMP receptor protein
MNETMTSGRNQLGCFSIWLESLSREAHREFSETMVRRNYEPGDCLFVQNSEAQGIFLLRSGRVKLVATSSSGKRMLLHIAVPGEVLGLGTLSGEPYELTAECMGSCTVDFIPRSQFLAFLKGRPEAGVLVALALSEDLDCAYERIRAFRAQGKTARRSSRSSRRVN